MFLLTLRGFNNRNCCKEFFREATAQEMAIVEAVSVYDPPGDIAMFDEALGSIGALDSFLNARTLASRATSGERAVMLNIKIKFNVLGGLGEYQQVMQ